MVNQSSAERSAALINKPASKLQAVDPRDANELLTGAVADWNTKEVIIKALQLGEGHLWQTNGGLYVVYDDLLFGAPVEVHHLGYSSVLGMHVIRDMYAYKIRILIKRVERYQTMATLIPLAGRGEWGGKDQGIVSLTDRFEAALEAVVKPLGDGFTTAWFRRLHALTQDDDAPRDVEALTALYNEIDAIRRALPDIPTEDEIFGAASNPWDVE